jgi:hypothetical protein
MLCPLRTKVVQQRTICVFNSGWFRGYIGELGGVVKGREECDVGFVYFDRCLSMILFGFIRKGVLTGVRK